MRGEIGDSHWLLVNVPREVGGRQGHLLISDQGMVDPHTKVEKSKGTSYLGTQTKEEPKHKKSKLAIVLLAISKFYWKILSKP